MSNKLKDTRCRNWTIILYPESAPENWRDIIDEWHIEWVESPLHDSDINATGEKKKAHWHILLMFSGVKTYEQVRELTDCLNCPAPEKCHNSKTLVRYFAHLDNPSKHQYNISDIIAHGGVDIDELLRPLNTQRRTFIKEMQTFIRDNCITEFCDFMDYAAEERFDDWYALLCDNSAIVISNYIRSQRHKFKERYKGDEN